MSNSRKDNNENMAWDLVERFVRWRDDYDFKKNFLKYKNQGYSPITMLCGPKCFPDMLLELLLQNNCNINIADSNNKTPFHILKTCPTIESALKTGKDIPDNFKQTINILYNAKLIRTYIDDLRMIDSSYPMELINVIKEYLGNSALLDSQSKSGQELVARLLKENFSEAEQLSWREKLECLESGHPIFIDKRKFKSAPMGDFSMFNVAEEEEDEYEPGGPKQLSSASSASSSSYLKKK